MKNVNSSIAAMNIQARPEAGSIVEVQSYDGWKRGTVTGFNGLIQVAFDNGDHGDVPYGLTPQPWRYAK